MSKVKEVTVSVGTPELSDDAKEKFELASSQHGKSQKTFLEACKLGMRDMRKWYKNDEERSFEVVKELARPICYKHMSEGTFSSFCSITRKLLHYGLNDWMTAKATVDELDGAKTIVEASKGKDNTYGGLSYEEAMKKQVFSIREKNRLKKLAAKVPTGLNCVAPAREQYASNEEFTAAIFEFLAFYLGHEELEEVVDDNDDLAKIKKIAAKHTPAAAEAAVA